MTTAATEPPPVMASILEEKITTRRARVGIVGLGYVGLPLALLFSEERFRVTGFDIDAMRKMESRFMSAGDLRS